jgi:hypothetical protein
VPPSGTIGYITHGNHFVNAGGSPVAPSGSRATGRYQTAATAMGKQGPASGLAFFLLTDALRRSRGPNTTTAAGDRPAAAAIFSHADHKRTKGGWDATTYCTTRGSPPARSL